MPVEPERIVEPRKGLLEAMRKNSARSSDLLEEMGSEKFAEVLSDYRSSVQLTIIAELKAYAPQQLNDMVIERALSKETRQAELMAEKLKQAYSQLHSFHHNMETELRSLWRARADEITQNATAHKWELFRLWVSRMCTTAGGLILLVLAYYLADKYHVPLPLKMYSTSAQSAQSAAIVDVLSKNLEAPPLPPSNPIPGPTVEPGIDKPTN